MTTPITVTRPVTCLVPSEFGDDYEFTFTHDSWGTTYTWNRRYSSVRATNTAMKKFDKYFNELADEIENGGRKYHIAGRLVENKYARKTSKVDDKRLANI